MTRNLFFCDEWVASSFIRHKGKKLFFPIRAVNFCKTFCTYFPSSLKYDLTVKNAKKKYFFSVWASWARNGSFEVFFEKKELRCLEVRPWICVFFIFKFYLSFLWICKLLPLYIVFSVPINIWEFFAPCFTTEVGFYWSRILLK
jgi:hypothetical protein